MSMPRSIPRGLAVGLGLLATLFYAAAPLFYSYFEGVYLSYGRAVPLAWQGYPPLVWWGDLAVFYQPARFATPSDNLACRMSSTSPRPRSAVAPDCAFALGRGDRIYGPYVALKRGIYTVHYRLAPSEGCEGGNVMVDVTAGARLLLASAEQRIAQPAIIDLPFELAGPAVLLQNLETRVLVKDGCVTVSGITIERTAAPGER
jgi:hypothetical protein